MARRMARTENISDAVIRRLPVYLRYLTQLQKMGIRTVSSQTLGHALNFNPAQIRKDLAFFGEFGRKGIGYEVDYLIEKIKEILHLDRVIPVCLVGAGNLGHALSNYNVYQNDQMKIVAVFDASPARIGKKIRHLTVQPLDELPRVVKEQGIRVGIITVPDYAAQDVANLMVEAGIEGILNFAPVILKTPEHVRVHQADVTAELFSLAYYISHDREEIRKEDEEGDF